MFHLWLYFLIWMSVVKFHQLWYDCRMEKNGLRRLPSVSKILEDTGVGLLVAEWGRSAVVDAAQAVLDELRGAMRGGKAVDVSVDAIVRGMAARLEAGARPKMKPAINATGILLHTGLGRAPMPEAARQAVASVAGCCTLQMDMNDGARVHREHAITELVCGLTGAEDVLVVNNNAAATMLCLRALAKGREVVVSRGELIEIGGAFRIPDIMEESGAVLREVGATNKTHLRDYVRAIVPETALLLKVHKSNYDIIGFTHEVSIGELAELGLKHSIPVLDDLGCGALVNLEAFGLGHEMTIQESLAAGADLVLASTDKLIGGPQGGLIVGKKALIDTIREHPLYRALRVCKLTLAALETTLRLFKNPETLTRTHPLYRMLARTPAELKQQAEGIVAKLGMRNEELGMVSVVEHQAYLGGGSLPGQALPSFAVSIAPTGDIATFARKLREAPCPVVPRIHHGAILLDMRTVLPEECDTLIATLSL